MTDLEKFDLSKKLRSYQVVVQSIKLFWWGRGGRGGGEGGACPVHTAMLVLEGCSLPPRYVFSNETVHIASLSQLHKI